jgi:hypothetical protein
MDKLCLLSMWQEERSACEENCDWSGGKWPPHNGYWSVVSSPRCYWSVDFFTALLLVQRAHALVHLGYAVLAHLTQSFAVLLFTWKGQCHQIVSEMSPWSSSLGLN